MPSRTNKARWAYCETRCSWARAQKGTEHRTSRATIFKDTVQEDQRVERDCSPANISFQVVVSSWVSGKCHRDLADRHYPTTLVIVNQPRNPRDHSQQPIENCRTPGPR